MRVLIKSIQVASSYVESKLVERPDSRKVECVSLDPYSNRLSFELPGVEVDGLINVGSVYEMMFARRES